MLVPVLLACGPLGEPDSPSKPLAPQAASTGPPSATPRNPRLTLEEAEAYGSRAAFFQRLPKAYRPDLDWRSVLSPALADASPWWSQAFEELVIRDFFADRRGGVFVDVGCHLPREMSTTYYLESRLGWTGVGIDVMGEYAPLWELHRPNSKFVRAAVSDKDGEMLELHVGAIATLDKELSDTFPSRTVPVTIEVETSTLNRLLDQEGIGKIDFLSMDIEGAELAGLRGFDIGRFRPDLCAVETAQPEAVNAYFEGNGYELIEKYRKADKINLYYRPKRDAQAPEHQAEG